METLGDNLLNDLEELRQKLCSLSSKLTSSGVERTVGIRDALGHDCPFYVKSLKLFFEKDYIELRDLIKSSNELFDRVEKEEND